MRYLWLASGLLLMASGRVPAMEPTSVAEMLGSEASHAPLLAASAAATTRIRDSLKAIYADGRPLWSTAAGPSPQARAVLATLADAESYGLRVKDYAVGAPAGAGGADDGGSARFDVALSTAALRFIDNLHFGRIDPAEDGFHLGQPPAPLDEPGVLRQLTTAASAEPIIASVEPQFYHYGLLKQALTQYRKLAADPTLAPLPPLTARSIKPGDPFPQAAAVRHLLHALGDFPDDAAAASAEPRLDPPLVEAVKRFQERHAIDADGAIGASTYSALSTPPAKRVRQIELTLERWRWLPPFTEPPIIVNIPQYRLFAFNSTRDRKADILQMDVIVGKSYPQTRTPVFADDMKFVIFRPYWDVPRSITLREELPKLRADPGYLERERLEIVRGGSESATPLPATPEVLAELAAGTVRLRQRPGPDNALGLVKFMLPNAYNVYLHSTPAQRLFGEAHRAFSHGCIRVSDPVALAQYVLRDTPGSWTREAIQAAMNGEDSHRVDLAHPIRVMIVYATVLATEAGPVLFFDDIYGHDRQLAAKLGLAPVG
jgi:L,D-transpeptidase YcbB